jgi:hypothetical protein
MYTMVQYVVLEQSHSGTRATCKPEDWYGRHAYSTAAAHPRVHAINLTLPPDVLSILVSCCDVVLF